MGLRRCTHRHLRHRTPGRTVAGWRRRVMRTVAAATLAVAVSAPAPAVAAPTGPATTGTDTTGTDTTLATDVPSATAPPASARAAEAWTRTTTEPAPVVDERTDPPRHPLPPSPPPTPPTPPVTYLVGDSITDMNRAVIAPVLDACGADVHLHSLSARRIEQSYEWNGGWVNSGLDEIDRILEVADPTTWIVELGSNDLQDIHSPDDAHRLIRAVLDRIGDDDVLWTTTLWPFHGSAMEIFNAALRDTPDIELVDWHAVGGDHLADPVHPTDEGARILAGLYCEALQ